MSTTTTITVTTTSAPASLAPPPPPLAGHLAKGWGDSDCVAWTVASYEARLKRRVQDALVLEIESSSKRVMGEGLKNFDRQAAAVEAEQRALEQKLADIKAQLDMVMYRAMQVKKDRCRFEMEFGALIKKFDPMQARATAAAESASVTTSADADSARYEEEEEDNEEATGGHDDEPLPLSLAELNIVSAGLSDTDVKATRKDLGVATPPGGTPVTASETAAAMALPPHAIRSLQIQFDSAGGQDEEKEGFKLPRRAAVRPPVVEIDDDDDTEEEDDDAEGAGGRETESGAGRMKKKAPHDQMRQDMKLQKLDRFPGMVNDWFYDEGDVIGSHEIICTLPILGEVGVAVGDNVRKICSIVNARQIDITIQGEVLSETYEVLKSRGLVAFMTPPECEINMRLRPLFSPPAMSFQTSTRRFPTMLDVTAVKTAITRSAHRETGGRHYAAQKCAACELVINDGAVAMPHCSRHRYHPACGMVLQLMCESSEATAGEMVRTCLGFQMCTRIKAGGKKVEVCKPFKARNARGKPVPLSVTNMAAGKSVKAVKRVQKGGE